MSDTLRDAVSHWAVVGDGNGVCARALHTRHRWLRHTYRCECSHFITPLTLLRRRALARWIAHVEGQWREQARKQGRPRRRPR